MIKRMNFLMGNNGRKIYRTEDFIHPQSKSHSSPENPVIQKQLFPNREPAHARFSVWDFLSFHT